MLTKRKLAVALSTLLISCSQNDLPKNTPSQQNVSTQTNASLVISLGKVRGGQCDAFRTSDGEVVVAATPVGIDGRCNIVIPDSVQELVVARYKGGEYFSEALGAYVPLESNEQLRTIVNPGQGGSSVSIAMTALTELAVRRFLSLSQQERDLTGLTRVKEEIADLIAPGLDIFAAPTIVDENLENGSLGSSDADLYAIALAGLDQFAISNGGSISGLIETIEDDLRDGVLGDETNTYYQSADGFDVELDQATQQQAQIRSDESGRTAANELASRERNTSVAAESTSTPTATPSPTTTPSSTATPSPTATPDGGVCPSPCPPPSASPSPTVSPTATPSSTATPSPTTTPSSTATPSPTATPDGGVCPSPCPPSVSPSPAPSPTVTPSSTATPLTTPSPTATPDGGVCPSPCPPSVSPSPAPSPTAKTSFSQNLTLESASFSAGSRMPVKYTCEGSDVSPEINWNQSVEGAKGFALIIDDPDAQSAVGYTFVHWNLFNIPSDYLQLQEQFSSGVVPDGITEGANDFGSSQYDGPCSSSTHNYDFKIFAVNENPLNPVPPSPMTIDEFEQQYGSKIIDSATFTAHHP